MLYKRVVAKFGTSLLTGGTDSLNSEIMSNLVKQVAQLYHEGTEIIIVTSGAVSAGRKKISGIKERKDIPFKQVLASLEQQVQAESVQPVLLAQLAQAQIALAGDMPAQRTAVAGLAQAGLH